jgi:hypothetical protein
MAFRSEWMVSTRFRRFLIRLAAASESPDSVDAAVPAEEELGPLYAELDRRDAALLRVLREVTAAARGPAFGDPFAADDEPLSALELADLKHDLQQAIETGTVIVEPRRPRRELARRPEPPAGAGDGSGTSSGADDQPPEDDAWIEIEFRDDQGRPLSGRQLSMVAGALQRAGGLDGTGFFRMSGLKPGTADVSFAAPEQESHDHDDLPDIQPAPPLPDPEPRVQARFVDSETDQPLARLSYSLLDSGGNEIATGVTDENGEIDQVVDAPGTFGITFHGPADDGQA